MKQYVICADEAELKNLLEAIEQIGITYSDGDKATSYRPDVFNIGYDPFDNGITLNWKDSNGKQTTIPRFLISLKIEKLKQERRALPKLENNK